MRSAGKWHFLLCIAVLCYLHASGYVVHLLQY